MSELTDALHMVSRELVKKKYQGRPVETVMAEILHRVADELELEAKTYV